MKKLKYIISFCLLFAVLGAVVTAAQNRSAQSGSAKAVANESAKTTEKTKTALQNSGKQTQGGKSDGVKAASAKSAAAKTPVGGSGKIKPIAGESSARQAAAKQIADKPSVTKPVVRPTAAGTAAAKQTGMHNRETQTAGKNNSGEGSDSTVGAKAIIYISLDGGASQTDTFDPKPEAGRDYAGNYRNPIKTNVDGIVIGEKLPRLASIADRFVLLRGMIINTNAHETGHYRMLTGDMTGGNVVYPSFGAMLSYLKEGEYDNPLFPYITLTASSTRFNEAGFLSPKYKPYDTGGSPAQKYFDVSGIYDHDIPDSLLVRRKALLETLSAAGQPVEQTEQVVLADQLREKSYDLILGDVRNAFDLSGEPESLRKKYGTTDFGQSCLAARKLVEQGVMVVVVRFRGWDTHKEHFKRMDQRLDELDQGVSALLLDLERKGLLESTIVLCGGEFGRTPRISWGPPWNGGRGHFGDAFSYLVAGGGFKGGIALGATDAKGEKVVERAVYPADLWATVYTLMGVDPLGTVAHPTLGQVPILPSYGKQGQSNGMLTEVIR